MGFWSGLFGDEHVVNKTIDGIYDSADALVYTDEEKVLDQREKTKLKIEWLKAYEPFKKVQRFLAMLTGIPFVLIHLVIIILWLTCLFRYIGSAETYKYIMTQLELVADMNNQVLGSPFMYISIFYFGGGAAEGAIKAFRNKK